MADTQSGYDTTTSYTTDSQGNKSKNVTKSKSASPGAAWKWKDGKWRRPKPPTKTKDSYGNNLSYSWDNNKGWVSNAAQANAYAVPLSVIKSDKTGELSRLFNEAWKSQKSGQEWSPEEFDVRLKATTWYKTKSESQRKYYTLSNDPAQATEFAKQIASSASNVADLAASIGATLSKEQLDELSKSVLQNGLTDAETRDMLSSYISFQGKSDVENIGSLFGTAGTAEDELRAMARDYGVQISDSWILDQARKVSAGDRTTADSKDEIVMLSKQNYGHWADKITKDMSLDTLASGFKQSVAEEMGKDYTSLTIDDPYIKQALNAKDDKGMPISMDSFKQTLRKTDDWAMVDKNKNKIMTVGQGILTKMGIM